MYANLLPFGLNEPQDSDKDFFSVGDQFAGEDGKEYVIVESAEATTADMVAGGVLKWSSQPDRQVVLADAAADGACGVIPEAYVGSGITSGQFFLMQIKGKAMVVRGDAGTNVAAGDLVGTSTSTNEGRVAQATGGNEFARALTAGAADGTEIEVELFSDMYSRS